ncbi:replication-relaxation family protein [Microbacterium saccharophilum]|uniref:replication-relaxation family protein n=1 Tax=Microbacterium saccharophilum TaxID=1213358 RepID=UPI002006052A|nr:replication-relaxation family protein [Microbacterium saccharophilum]
MRALRGDPDRRKFQQPGSVFVLHTLAVADVAVELLEHTRLGLYEVLELEPEPVCWRTFQSGSGVLTLKPDLLAVTADSETESHFFIEVDRGTEHLPAIRRKCDLYQRYYRDGSEERLRGLYPAVVWIAPDELRANAMREAIEKDRNLDTDLFTVITTEDALSTLAPYGPPTTTDSPRKEDHHP